MILFVNDHIFLKTMQSINVLTARRVVNQTRFLSSSAVHNHNNKYKKEPYKTVDQILHPVGGFPYKVHPSKVFYKLLYRDKRENPFFVSPPVGRPSINIETAAASVYTNRICTAKRVRVLNKLFMRYIPEILATSELGIPLLDYDIQFSGVKVGQHYNIVNVYWIPKGTEEDEAIQQLLNQVAYPLRTEIINLKLMGLVPPIHFVKDKRHAFILEIERRLRIADYGEDYVPSFINENPLKRDLKLEAELPRELRERIISTDEQVELTDREERDVPPMITNTLGLDYKRIMNSVVEGKKKSRIHNQSMESLIGKSALKKVSFEYEPQPMESWDRKAFIQYMKQQRNKRKLVMKARNRQLSDDLREASQRTFTDQEEVDESEYVEFVQNAFPDDVENFEDEDSLELEQ